MLVSTTCLSLRTHAVRCLSLPSLSGPRGALMRSTLLARGRRLGDVARALAGGEGAEDAADHFGLARLDGALTVAVTR